MLSSRKTVKGLLLGALFFSSTHIFAQYADGPLWKEKQWLRLLHYNKTLFGYVSEADNKEFFLNEKKGRTSPEKELEALIEGIEKNDPDEKLNAYCRFPARIRWLKKFRPVPDSHVECKNLNAFRKRLSAKSISVVFSSYYLGNPASSFGHTFIRLGKEPMNEKGEMLDSTATELLDTGINYGAMTGGANAVAYALGGLAGFFSGNYNAIPYYYKVREYNDYEARDLWSYNLNMTQEEIDFIADHIWELGHAFFDYYFLSENCSYHVLTTLEASRPSLELRRHMPKLYTIPSETLKALKQEGLVRKITFRPAASTLFYHQLSILSGDEQKQVKDLFFHLKPIHSEDPHRAALMYDTALSLIDYKYAKDILKQDEDAQKIKRPVLIARSKIPVRSPDLDFSDRLKYAPDLGHGQNRLALSGINQEGVRSAEAEWRFAFHDFLDYDVGYPPGMKLDVLKFKLRTEGHKVQFREAYLVDVMTLGKWDAYNNAVSWKFKAGQWQTRMHKQDLSTQGVQAGFGYSVQLGVVQPYLLAHGESSYLSEKEMKMKFAYGSDAGLLFNFNHHLKLNTVLEWRAYPWLESRWFNEVRWSNAVWGAGLYQQSWLVDGAQEIGVRSLFYF
jgi:hypothetical protein